MGYKTFEVVVVTLLLMLLSFDVFVTTSVCVCVRFVDKWFVQIYLNVILNLMDCKFFNICNYGWTFVPMLDW